MTKLRKQTALERISFLVGPKDPKNIDTDQFFSGSFSGRTLQSTQVTRERYFWNLNGVLKIANEISEFPYKFP